MKRLVVVLDTNVLISALRSSAGASFQLLLLLRRGVLQPAVTTPLVLEYQDVLSRPGMLLHLSSVEISSFLDWFVSISSGHKVHFLWRPLAPDPKDDLVIEAAIAASADCLITHNVADSGKRRVWVCTSQRLRVC